jgi:hypothetical protein
VIALITLLLLASDGQRNLSPATPFEDVTDESDGQWITVRIVLSTTEDALDGKTFYGCISDNEVSRSVCFSGLIDLNETVPPRCDGRLRCHPALADDN